MKYKAIHGQSNLYFVSSVITDHKTLFTNRKLALIPLNSLNWFREEKFWRLFAFCLMPNHIHFIVEVLGSHKIENLVARFHSFTGHRIVKCLKEMHENELLDFFKAVAFAKKPDRNYLIWEDAVVRMIETEHVAFELIEYTHNNPVRKKWKLAEARSDYPYSSARHYDLGLPPLVPINDIRQFL